MDWGCEIAADNAAEEMKGYYKRSSSTAMTLLHWCLAGLDVRLPNADSPQIVAPLTVDRTEAATATAVNTPRLLPLKPLYHFLESAYCTDRNHLLHAERLILPGRGYLK